MGGTERATTVVASELANSGFEVCILSMSGGNKSAYPIDTSVKLKSLQMEHESANFSDMKRWRCIRRFMTDEKPCIWIDVEMLLTWYSWPSSLGLSIKTISWEHFHRGINFGGIGQRLRRSLGRKIATKFSAAIVTLTERDQKNYLFLDICRAPIVTIPNPNSFAKTRNFIEREKIVLSVGRLVNQKGFDRLLDAWALISKNNRDSWRLRIVGSGPEQANLVNQCEMLKISDSVEFLAATSNISNQYAVASIFAAASRFEGLPLVLIEAKQHGLPIVSFDCECGPSEIILNNIDGALVIDGNISEFANSLEQLMNNEEVRKKYSTNAQLDLRFNIERIKPMWLQLISRIQDSSNIQ